VLGISLDKVILFLSFLVLFECPLLADPVLLIQHSRVHPGSAVLVGDDLFYSEQTSDPICRNKDVWKYSYKTQMEQRVTVPCVLGLIPARGNLYVSYRPDGIGKAKIGVLSDGKIVPPKGSFAHQLARLDYLVRDFQEQSRESGKIIGDMAPLWWSVDTNEQFIVAYGTVNAEDPLLVAVFSMTARPRIFSLNDIPATRVTDFTTNGKQALVVLSPQGKSSSELVLIDIAKGEIEKRFGGDQISTEALYQPGIARPSAEGFILIERSPNRPKVAYKLDSKSAVFKRIEIPTADTVDMYPVHDGWIAAKPLTRAVIYYGNALPNAALWSQKNTPTAKHESTGNDFNDHCESFSITRLGPKDFQIVSKDQAEWIPLGNISGLVSLACEKQSVAFIATGFEFLEGLSLNVIDQELESNVKVSNSPITSKVPLFFVISGKGLVLVRQSLLETTFSSVAVLEHSFAVYLNYLKPQNEIFGNWEYHNIVPLNGRHFSAFAGLAPKEHKEFFEMGTVK
jgi:hypothetical protein